MSPLHPIPDLDIQAWSGILGSISIACWAVVYSPQIIENFRRSSADGLSLAFLIIWLCGDISNVLGAIIQGVLPTMTILAVYYVFADFVLLGQRFYYRGSGPSGRAAEVDYLEGPTEETSLLGCESSNGIDPSSKGGFVDLERPSSLANPTPLGTAAAPYPPSAAGPEIFLTPSSSSFSSSSSISSLLLSILYKFSVVLLVCSAGVLGWYLSFRSSHSQQHTPSNPPPDSHHHDPDSPDQNTSPPHLKFWGQFFGYLCAALYLGSRIPQIMLNHRRKSTEGVSILFFIFCCVGNITYTMSIFAYEPHCVGIEGIGDRRGRTCEDGGDWQRAYWRYILVDASWVLGSVGALLLDLIIFGQFWVYRGRKR